MKKKQRGLADNKNANNKEQSKILLITLSVMAIILTVTFSVVVIMIPPQREVSFVGDSVFIRKCSSTIEVRNSREIIALNNRFLQ